MANDEKTGGCLCGSVRFRIAGALRDVVFCHCGQCRRQTGHFYAATNVDDRAIRVSGEEHVTWYAASEDAKRGFCSHCGSALFWKHRADSHVSVLAGAFDQPSGLKPGYHIFVADKGDHYEIGDGLPQHAKGAPGLLVAED